MAYYRPNLPGHGVLNSTRFQLDDAVKEVTQIIKLENTRRIMVVGLSLGGYVAMKVAQSLPESVAGLVISGAMINYACLLTLNLPETG